MKVIFIVLGVKITLIVKNTGAAFEFNTGKPAVFFQKPSRTITGDNFNSLFKSLFNLVVPGRHFFTGLETYYSNVLGSKAPGSHRHIYGHIPAANHNNLIVEGNLSAESDVPEKGDAMEDTFGVFTFHTKFAAAMEACRQKNSLEAIRLKPFQGDLFTKGDTRLDLNSHFLNDFDFRVQNISGETVGRNAHSHHPTGKRKLLKDRHLITFLREIIGRRQAGRSRTYNRYLICVLSRQGIAVFFCMILSDVF